MNQRKGASASPPSPNQGAANADLHSNPKRVPPKEAGARRVGIVSDTHGWLDPALLEHFAGCEHILHVGDVGDPDVLAQLATVAPVTAVRGNIDHGRLRDLPLEAHFDFGGLKIALLHIAGSPRRPHRDALALILRERPEVFLAGHSHIPVVAKVEGALWINPGAAGHQGFHDLRTAMVFEIPAGQGMAEGRAERSGTAEGWAEDTRASAPASATVSPRLYRIELGPRGRRA